MKTKITTKIAKRISTSLKNKKQIVQISTTYLLVLFMLLLSSKKMLSQTQLLKPKGKIGVGLFGQISVNGYGTEYLPTVYYKKGRKSLFVAPTIQKQKANLSGMQVTYQYCLTGSEIPGHDKGELELFVFLTAGYHHNAMLGKITERNEQRANPLFTENGGSSYRYNSIEVFGGIGLNIPFLKRFKWTNCIGLGGYTSFNFPSHLFYQDHNIGIILKTGITMDIRKHK